MNAILDPVDVSFEQALPELRGEAAADRARRVIEEQAHDLEDLVAGGASLEDLAAETDMELGEIEFSADTPPQGIAAYEAFRELAPALTEGEFLQLHQLDDGGLFALRLDQLIAPELIPFEQVRELVLADWTAAETRRELKIRAEERELVLESVANGDLPTAPVETDAAAGSDAPPAPATPTFQTAADVERDFGIEGVPGAVVTQGFMLEDIGDAAAVEAEGRVFLIRLDAIRSADLSAPESQPVLNGVEARLTESVRSDLFDAYVRALQASHGATINDSALSAANAMIQ